MGDAAFYEPLGEGRYAATVATAGPWSADFQHAGPVTGLLGRAFERHGSRIARVTVDLLGPVPVAELEVETRVVRPGRRVSLLEGEMLHEGRPIVRATAWRVVQAPDGVPPTRNAPAPPPLPDVTEPMGAWRGAHMDGYLSAMEWRVTSGAFDQRGPGTTWARSRVPLVAGEADSPLVRALVLADTASGIGTELDLERFLVINTDLTVALHREPRGEWLCLDAAIHASPGGSALAHGTLSDTSGEFGHALQTLLVDDLPTG